MVLRMDQDAGRGGLRQCRFAVDGILVCHGRVGRALVQSVMLHLHGRHGRGTPSAYRHKIVVIEQGLHQ